MVMQEYLSLKEANKQLKEQAHHHHTIAFAFPPRSLINYCNPVLDSDR